MCGITAIITINGTDHSNASKPNVDTRQSLIEEVSSSLEHIKHRGPDAQGVWISDDESVALGHARLSIIDPTPAANQPLHSTDNKVHAVVNGELYDYEKIREELIAKGYQFRSHSDSEIVINLYKEHGIGLVSHLRGEFAIIIYDEETRTIYAIRDRYGIKPLFYTVVNGRILIASEAKAFLPLGWKPQWDVKSIIEGGWLQDQRTVFKRVSKVRPGQYIVATPDGAIENRVYWDLEYPNKKGKETRTVDEMVQGVRERLVDAVRVRLRADVPVAVYLSGGVDSSAVAGIATHLVKERSIRVGNAAEGSTNITCFGIEFEGDQFNEGPFARRTAEHLGISYIPMNASEEKLVANFSNATIHNEHPIGDMNFVGKYLLSKFATEHGFKVALTGEGSDEHFAGYAPLYSDRVGEQDLTFDTGVDDSVRLQYLEKIRNNPNAFGPLYASFTSDYGTVSGSRALRMTNNLRMPLLRGGVFGAFGILPESVFAKWTKKLSPASVALTIANSVDGVVREKILKKWHPLHSSLYIWTRGILSNQLLTALGDRTEMAHSLEARTPFLDHNLTEYANYLPPSAKMYINPDGTFTDKWILREAVKPFITQELYERRKHPYTARNIYPVGGHVHQLVLSIATEENIRALGWCSWDFVQTMMKKGFEENDAAVVRYLLVICQFVVIGKHFGIPAATEKYC